MRALVIAAATAAVLAGCSAQSAVSVETGAGTSPPSTSAPAAPPPASTVTSTGQVTVRAVETSTRQVAAVRVVTATTTHLVTPTPTTVTPPPVTTTVTETADTTVTRTGPTKTVTGPPVCRDTTGKSVGCP